MTTSATPPIGANRATRALFALLVTAVLAAACSSSSDGTATDTTAPTATEEPAAEPPSTPTPEPVEEATPAAPTAVPVADEPAAENTAPSTETPAGETLEWVVQLLNNQEPDPAEVAAMFAPQFLEIVPIEQILGALPQFWGGEWTIASADVDDFTATAVLTAEGELDLDMGLTVSPIEPHLIEGLLFTPAVDTPDVATADEYEQALDGIAPQSRAAIFEIVNGECATVIDLGAESIMPIGSIFKLWILAELAHQVESGEAAWDETLAIRDSYKSSPDGTIFSMVEGTEVTLREYAAEMISISDNSATDHLLYRLGRERIEAAMATSGVAQPTRNIPMLATAELFRLKFDPEPPNAVDYRALDPNERRELLDAMQAETWVDDIASLPLTNADGVSIDNPRDHDLEWFATPLDLCRTHAYLAELAARPGLEPVAEILSINPTAGMDFDQDVWTDLRYKGGSEQGIVAVAWWMQRNDGRTFVLAGGVENPDAPINPVAAVGVLQQGANLAAALD